MVQTASMPPAKEDLIVAMVQRSGDFLPSHSQELKHGRYKIIRKLREGQCSATYLVKDSQTPPSASSRTFLAAKILTTHATELLHKSEMRELRILQTVAAWDGLEPRLPILHDHFPQSGPQGDHYCFLTQSVGRDLRRFQDSAPGRRLGVHFVKPIMAWICRSLALLHELNIIHADINVDNILFDRLPQNVIQQLVESAEASSSIDQAQPLPLFFSWDDDPHEAELISVVIGDLGSALWANGAHQSGDIGAFVLRAPENVVRAQSGKEIDIWAVGCMTYELLTGQALFRPEVKDDLTADESLLLLQYALTGETFSKDIVQQSQAKCQYFDRRGNLIKANTLAYPRTTLVELLTLNTELNATRVAAAAAFIGSCLRLNPADRATAENLHEHHWLETAFMGGEDEENPKHRPSSSTVS